MPSELVALFGKKRSEALDLDRLPPFLRDYARTAGRFTDARSGLLLTAWLPFIAVNIGNRAYMVNNSTRVYPNIWSCLIGPSSVSRKTTALRYAEYTLRPHEAALDIAPLDYYEAKTLILTGVTLSKLMSLLALSSTRLFVHNELSAWLAEMNKHFNQGYKQAITEIYDGVDKTVSNQTRTERIRKPAFSVATATTEAWLYKNIRDSGDQLGGFLQRFIFYVVRNVDLAEIDLNTRSGAELEDIFADYDRVFARLRAIDEPLRLELSPEAAQLRSDAYEDRYKRWFPKNNDALMSYFTRVYDGYFFKFCLIIALFERAAGIVNQSQATSASQPHPTTTQSQTIVIPGSGVPGEAQSGSLGWIDRESSLFTQSASAGSAADPGPSPVPPSIGVNPGNSWTAPPALDDPIGPQTAEQALYLCDFYFRNTIPFLEIVDEQDKLSAERKLVELIIAKYGGKARHSDLMNISHMRKREFRDCIESLLEREAITVETYRTSKNVAGKMYVLNPEIIESWAG